MIPGAEKQPSAQPPGITELYETLRQAALGEPLPPPARNGLILFLRRGMWAWAQAAASVRQKPISSPCSGSTQDCYEPTAIVHVFAAMAINIQDGRAS